MNFYIGKRSVGPDQPVFIIAELSANHGGKYNIACESLKAAAKAGADAVKLQTYTPDTITLDCDTADFTISQGTVWDGRKLHDLYAEAYTPWDWQPRLMELANQLGILLFSSPFDFTAVDFLEKMAVPAYKIASFEVTDIPLIEKVASTGKPVILSTGIATPGELDDALAACYRVGNSDIALLKCTSAYPAPSNEMNLKMIPELARKYRVVSGLSDHTLGIEAPVAATALGASIIEKHFILDKTIGGPDASFSLDLDEFSAMVQAVRRTEQMLGQEFCELTATALRSRAFARSLYVAVDIPAGAVVTAGNVRSVRPGYGLPPKHLPLILGRRVRHALKKGTPLQWDDLE